MHRRPKKVFFIEETGIYWLAKTTACLTLLQGVNLVQIKTRSQKKHYVKIVGATRRLGFHTTMPLAVSLIVKMLPPIL